MKRFLTLTSTLLAALCAFAQSVQTLGFKPQSVRPNEMASYVISIKDASPKIDISDIPVPDGLQFVGTGRSERFVMSSGQGAQRETQLSFNFIPLKEGEYEIKAWQLKDGGKVYDIAAAKLTADPNAPQNVRARASRMPDPFEEFDDFFNGGGMSARRSARPAQEQVINLNEEIALSLELPKEKIYVGEAVECKVAVKFNRKIFDAEFSLNGLEPRIKDSDAFYCAGFKKEPYEKPAPDGNSTTVYFDTLVIPLKAGKLNLQFEALGVLVNRSMGGGFFSLRTFGQQHQFTSNMKPLELEVLELPKEGMPADFSGAIGEFKVDSATLDESSLSVGEPCVLTVKISGKGNFERMSAPGLLDKEGWKEYKPKSSFLDAGAGYANEGTKTFEYTIIPQKPDLQIAPIAKLSYFDPASGEYKTIESSPVKVSVAPSKSYAKRSAEEKQSEKPADPLDVVNKNSGSNTFAVASPWFWALQGAILAALAFFIVYKRNKLRLENDPVYARKIAAKAELKSELSKAKSAAAGGRAKEFFEAASSSLQNAISLSSELQARAVTLSDAERELARLGFGGETLGLVKTFFEGADAIAYGGLAPQDLNLGNLYKNLEEICSQISQK